MVAVIRGKRLKNSRVKRQRRKIYLRKCTLKRIKRNARLKNLSKSAFVISAIVEFLNAYKFQNLFFYKEIK